MVLKENESKEFHYGGDLLMVRRFRTLGKLCSIIIYGGSSVNVASLRLVEKFSIFTFLHPNLISCNDIGGRQTNCFVIWFLWKPHDGVTNRFSFEHIRLKVILKPLSSLEVFKDQHKMKKKKREEERKESDKVERAKRKEREREKNKEKSKSLRGNKEVKRVESTKEKEKNECENSMLEDFKDVFLKYVLYGLPSLRGIEHHIDLTLGATFPNRTAYRANPKESKEIQKHVGKLIEKSWVRKNMSPCFMTIILIPKKDGTWRMCMDYRLINVVMWLPSNKGKTKYGLYECLVMLFDLTNAPNTFMRLMNHVLRSLIGKCMVVYFDDIFVYSTYVDDHIMHVKSVLELLRKECLYVNLKRCTFCTNKVIFWSFVGSHGVKVDEEKVKVIQSWPTRKSMSDVRSFRGLASFYLCFVKDFSTIVALLNEILKKNVGFKWEESQEKAFQVLKDRLTHALILALPNFTKSFELECDAINVGINKDTLFHILVKNLKVHNLIILLMIKSYMLYDHESLKPLRARNKLNKRHAKWVERHALLTMLETKLLGFEELYIEDDDFKETFDLCANLANGGFYKHDWFLYKEKRLCESKSSIRKLVVKETHENVQWVTLGNLRPLRS
ncbi:hypothetical protein CR513_52345, partial [Mucuna pruriens]